MDSIFALTQRASFPFLRIAMGVVLLWIGGLKGDLAGHGWTRIGGILGFATAIAAFYGSFAGVINSTFGRVIAPLFPLTGTIPGARR